MRIPSSSIGILRFQTISIHMMSRRCIEHTSAEGRSTHHPRQCRRPVCVQSCHSRGVPHGGENPLPHPPSKRVSPPRKPPLAEMVPLTGNSSFIEEFSPETSPLPSLWHYFRQDIKCWEYVVEVEWGVTSSHSTETRLSNRRYELLPNAMVSTSINYHM